MLNYEKELKRNGTVPRRRQCSLEQRFLELLGKFTYVAICAALCGVAFMILLNVLEFIISWACV